MSFVCLWFTFCDIAKCELAPEERHWDIFIMCQLLSRNETKSLKYSNYIIYLKKINDAYFCRQKHKSKDTKTLVQILSFLFFASQFLPCHPQNIHKTTSAGYYHKAWAPLIESIWRQHTQHESPALSVPQTCSCFRPSSVYSSPCTSDFLSSLSENQKVTQLCLQHICQMFIDLWFVPKKYFALNGIFWF